MFFYDRILTINAPTESVSATGDRSIAWNDVAGNVPCSVVPNGGVETFNEEQRVASNTIVFAIRYPHSFSVVESNQIIYEGSTYNVTNSYDNTKAGRRVELLITALRKDNS
jgi:SPP1 family predicted phage head-tail adaptor